MADQRRKYGESVLRRCDEQIAIQKQHENETQAKMDDARRKRQEDRDRQEAIEVSMPNIVCRFKSEVILARAAGSAS
jgi:hypothetical protein